MNNEWIDRKMEGTTSTLLHIRDNIYITTSPCIYIGNI